MSKMYFVHANGSNHGPFEIQVIVDMVQNEKLKATDYLYLEEKQDWILICQHPEFTQSFANTLATPQKPSGPASPLASNTVEWFALKDKNRVGPLSFADVVKMLQEKTIFEYDYVWKAGMENWQRIAELSEFAHDRIRHLFTNDNNAEGVFFRRKFKRSKYTCEVFVHDNSKVWKGRTEELSEGGASIVMENAMLVPGQKVFIHFKPGPSTKAFNVLCEVVNKRYQKEIESENSPIVYGVRFINIHKQDRGGLGISGTAA